MNISDQSAQIALNPDTTPAWQYEASVQRDAAPAAGAPVGMVLVGIILGLVAGGAAMLLGTSFLMSLLIYAVTGAVSVLALAVSFAVREEFQGSTQ